MKSLRIRFRSTTKNVALVLALASIGLSGCQEDTTVKEEETVKVKEESVKEEPKEVTEMQVPSSDNFKTSLPKFLDKLGESKGQPIQTFISDGSSEITGLYAYAGMVESIEKDTVSVDLGMSTISIPKPKLSAFDGFSENHSEIKDDWSGLVIVEYEKDVIKSVNFHRFDHDQEVVREAVLEYKEKEIASESSEISDKEAVPMGMVAYSDLEADNWRGMALMTAREISNSGMAPIFLVPQTNVNGKALLTDTFYYILAGKVIESSPTLTVMETYEGRTIKLNFGTVIPKEGLGHPSWIHAVTYEGEIQSLEIQPFPSADLEIMSKGVLEYINVSAAFTTPEE